MENEDNLVHRFAVMTTAYQARPHGLSASLTKVALTTKVMVDYLVRVHWRVTVQKYCVNKALFKTRDSGLFSDEDWEMFSTLVEEHRLNMAFQVSDILTECN